MHIQTTFAHGNGPFSRMVDLILAYNDVREANRKERLSAIFPLIPSYAFKGKKPGSRQVQFMKEIAEESKPDFLKKHPYELLLDPIIGEVLESVFYTEDNYEQALQKFIQNTEKANEDWRKRTEQGKVHLKNLEGEIIELDLRDSELEFGLNNRIASQHPNAYYFNGGAGYFEEVLQRAIRMPLSQVSIDRDLMLKAISLAEELTHYQKMHFLSDPGVFSYDTERKPLKPTEINTPPHIHVPKLDNTLLPRDGVYVVVTGIEGLASSGFCDAASSLNLQLYSGDDDFNRKFKGIKHPPFRVANPRIKAQVARTGWSSVWTIHMLAEHGLNVALLYPKHNPSDDPEILFNNMGVEKLGLGVEINIDKPKQSLEKALKIAENNAQFNFSLKERYGTIDGINYTAKQIYEHQNNTYS